MKILYYIYQICFALPILLVLTILTALVTIVGSLIGGAHLGILPRKNMVATHLCLPAYPRESARTGENT